MPFNPNMPGGGAMVPRGPQGSMPMQAPQVNPMMGMQRPRIPMPMPGQAPQQGGQMMQRPMPGAVPTPPMSGPLLPMPGGVPRAPMSGPLLPYTPRPSPTPIPPMSGPLLPLPGDIGAAPVGYRPPQMPMQNPGQQGNQTGALQALLGVPNYSALQSRLRGVLGV